MNCPRARGASGDASRLGSLVVDPHLWQYRPQRSVSRITRMTTFDDRENAFENKFAHDAEMQFRAEARRNKLLGLWAAELLGMDQAAAQDYAKSVVKADFEEAGHEDVVRKVAGDLGELSSAEDVRAKMAELLVVAKGQLMKEV
jgi:hypothetical protein